MSQDKKTANHPSRGKSRGTPIPSSQLPTICPYPLRPRTDPLDEIRAEPPPISGKNRGRSPRNEASLRAGNSTSSTVIPSENFAYKRNRIICISAIPQTQKSAGPGSTTEQEHLPPAWHIPSVGPVSQGRLVNKCERSYGQPLRDVSSARGKNPRRLVLLFLSKFIVNWIIMNYLYRLLYKIFQSIPRARTLPSLPENGGISSSKVRFTSYSQHPIPKLFFLFA